MDSSCSTARQTRLLSPTLPQSRRNDSAATEPPSTVFVSPRSSSMYRSPLASFEEGHEGDGERAPHNSRYASSTNRPRSSTLIHSVSAHLSTATGKRGASSAATTVRTSLANGSSTTGNSASKPRQSRHQPSLIITNGCSRDAADKRPAACSTWTSGPPAAASPVTSPTSPTPSSLAAAAPRKQPSRKKSVAAPTVAWKRPARYTTTATTTRCSTLAPGVHQDSYTKLESPKGRMPESDSNDANEGVDWACVDVDLRDLLRERMQLARANAAAPQADAVASTSVGDAGQDKNAGGDSGSMILSPQGRTSPAPEDGVATEPAAMVADDDLATADMNILVAVRVRPHTSLLTAKGAPLTSPLTDTAARCLFPASSASSHNAEQQPPCELRSSGGDWDEGLSTQVSTVGGGSLVEERQRTANSTLSHSATVCGRRFASRRVMPKAEKSDAGNSDSKDKASREVCVSADARNGFIDCPVAVAANASGGARTPTTTPAAAANGATAGQRIRTLRFHFDHILDDSVTQADVMACIGQRAVARVLQGYHSTVMCYGQTGSGKTYTIAGPHGGKLSRKALRWLASQPGSAEAVKCDDGNVDEEEQARAASDVGLLPRILTQLFRGLEARHGADATAATPGDGRRQQASAAPTSSWQVTLSALELYNNDMRDLLPGELPKNEEATLGKKDVSHPSAATRLHHHCNSSHISDHRKATASAVKRGRGQLSTSPSPCAAQNGTRASQRVSSRRGNSATTRNHPPTAAVSTPRATSHAGAGTAMRSAKTIPMKWTAPTTTHAAPQLQIRLGAPASSASQTSPPTKLKKARAVSPPPSSWASLRQPSHDAGSEAVHIQGLRKHQVHDIHAAMEAVWLALKQRHTGRTELNKSSSRSHAFFFVRVEQHERHSRDGEKPACTTRCSTLSLVDLAGSERVSRTGAHGLQLKEAQNINRSLSVLGNVMRLLSSSARSSLSKNSTTTSASSAAALTGASADQHIPYRDSKLTRILQSSLGGNAIAFLLCNVSPDSRDAQETLSTLRFAKLCKNVKSNAKLNETTADAEDAKAAAEAKICQLAVDASTAHNRLQQLATYTWWLEGHLGYFAAATIRHHQQQQQQRQRLSGTLTTSASMRAVTSSSRSRGSSGGRGLVVSEETTAPKVISGERSAGARNGSMQKLDSLESRGVENKEGADPGASPEGCRRSAAPAGPTSPEWWYLSPRPSSPTAPADDDKDDGGGGAAEAEGYWRSASSRALLSPAYPIAQRRMELQRKLIAAAAATTTIEDPAMLTMLYSTDAAVGEAEATARDRVIDGTNPLEISSTASTSSTSTRDGGSGVLMSKPATIPVSRGVSSASEETRAPTRHLRPSPPEHARAATQARLAEVEQSNVLLRLRLAELLGRMQQEGGNAHVAECHQAMNAEKAARGTVGKDYSWAPSSLAAAPTPLPSPAEASASRVLWPPHYSRASHDASLKVFLARCGFAAMDSMAPADAAMSPRRLA